MSALPPAMTLHARLEDWPMVRPFRITGQTFTMSRVVVAELSFQGHTGLGEACGVGYRDDTPERILTQLQGVAGLLQDEVTHADLLQILPAGGARNALDAALWDLNAKRNRKPAWSSAGLSCPNPLLTTFTVGADTPAEMAVRAWAYKGAKAIKLKLTGDGSDGARVEAVRAALPDVWLGVDANQGFTPDGLSALWPTLQAMDVKMVEQPFPIGRDAWMDGVERAIPVIADESLQTAADLPALVGRYDGINIKLDKCGGLTHGLEIARQARAMGLTVMVGNMTGTSWSQAPAFLLGQVCDLVDLDGPLFLKDDRAPGVTYRDGFVDCAETVWGGPGV